MRGRVIGFAALGAVALGAPLRPQVRALMADPRLTVAVVGLPSLAKPGGILDDLVAAGFKISGPIWKR
jgi:hypothetical protein